MFITLVLVSSEAQTFRSMYTITIHSYTSFVTQLLGVMRAAIEYKRFPHISWLFLLCVEFVDALSIKTSENVCPQ